MPILSRRRSKNTHQETWHIYFADVRIGQVGMRAGVPTHADQWGWSLGFYPGMEPGPRGYHSGTAATFEQARADFETQWHAVEPTLTEDQYQAWRRSRDFNAWKCRMWESGCRMPTQNRDGWSTCFCGERIPIACGDHLYTAPRKHRRS